MTNKQYLEQREIQLKQEILLLEQNKQLELEERIRSIAAKQYKLMCVKTRLELLAGRVNHESSLIRYSNNQ